MAVGCSTRAATLSTLNSLWVVDTTLATPEPQALKINGVLWADFAPDSQSIAYSRAEPSPGLPGWKALNDLSIVPFNNGKLGKSKEIIKASASAPYAWWGTTYAWSPDGKWLAYANTAEIGLISPTARITRTLPIIELCGLQHPIDLGVDSDAELVARWTIPDRADPFALALGESD